MSQSKKLQTENNEGTCMTLQIRSDELKETIDSAVDFPWKEIEIDPKTKSHDKDFALKKGPITIYIRKDGDRWQTSNVRTDGQTYEGRREYVTKQLVELRSSLIAISIDNLDIVDEDPLNEDPARSHLNNS